MSKTLNDIKTPIITSMLDDDWYKLTMGAVVFHHFPKAHVMYRFFNRGKTPFPKGFAEALTWQIYQMADLRVTPEEGAWLDKSVLPPTYVEWYKNFRLDPNELHISQEGGELTIYISGYWYRTIHWEVKLMALISELYFRMTGQKADSLWLERIDKKAELLSKYQTLWIDFGTRRRYSFAVQEEVVRTMKTAKGFLGTSNPFLAFKYGVKVNGTYAHEAVMAMSALYGPRQANPAWLKLWSDFYQGNLGIALTDTFTTGVFLKDFNSYYARLFDGARQDSGNPYDWTEAKMFPRYQELGIPTNSKTFVYSDSLGVDEPNITRVGKNYNYVALSTTYSGLVRPIGGIGTNLSNDVGVTPLNMVIKLIKADFGDGLKNVVKLSDDLGKNTGEVDAVADVRRILSV